MEEDFREKGLLAFLQEIGKRNRQRLLDLAREIDSRRWSEFSQFWPGGMFSVPKELWQGIGSRNPCVLFPDGTLHYFSDFTDPGKREDLGEVPLEDYSGRLSTWAQEELEGVLNLQKISRIQRRR